MPTVGTDVEVLITFVNSGREPATGVAIANKGHILPDFDIENNTTILRKDAEECLAKESAAGTTVVFPAAGGSVHHQHVYFDKTMIEAKVISGDKVIIVTGCYIYQTFGVAHHSAYCFYYNNTIGSRHLDFCNEGNNAD